MEVDSPISDAKVFARYAGDALDKWQTLVGCCVTHCQWRQGRITEVARGGSGSIVLRVSFSSDTEPFRRYRLEQFCTKHFFPDVALPTDLSEALEPVRSQIRIEEERRVEAEQREMEEQRRKEREAKAAEEWRRQQKEEEERQRAQEARDTAEFADLKSKYLAEQYPDRSPSSFLYPILLHIDSGGLLSKERANWLFQHKLYGTLALYLQQEFEMTGNHWCLVRASSAWRYADDTDSALNLTAWLLQHSDPRDHKLRAAILTSRGGAFRDIAELTAAERCAREAIDHHASHYPYNLLGAIHFERGEAEAGEKCFALAEKLGAEPRDRESEMKGALKRSGVEERRAVAEFLLRKDPVRYAWAAYYLR